MRNLINPAFAKEVQLDRPVRTWGERVFRFCLYFFVVSSLLGGAAEALGVDKKVGDAMGFMMWPFALTFLFSFMYMLGYAYAHYMPRRKSYSDILPIRSDDDPSRRSEAEPNKAPEPTTTAVTSRAPSSTSRAGCGRGSS